MPATTQISGWTILPPETLPPAKRLAHVRQCSDVAAGLLDRFPAWQHGLDLAAPPDVTELLEQVRDNGLPAGLRRFRNREMLRIVWRDLCGLAPLGETFGNLTVLAEICKRRSSTIWNSWKTSTARRGAQTASPSGCS